jgi:glycosyltransferase involved in cell wall biosynthesis
MISGTRKIAFNLIPLSQKISGIRNYSLETFAALVAARPDHHPYEFHVVTTREGAIVLKANDLHNLPATRIHIVGDTPRRSSTRLWAQLFSINQILKAENIHLLHCFDYLIPLYTPSFTRTVATVLDLIWRDHPATYSVPKLMFKKVFFKRSLRKADAIIAISQFTADRIIKAFGSDLKDKIHVVYCGLRTAFKQAAKEIPTSIPYSYEYLLAVGKFLPHKNYRRLIEAYGRLDTQYHLVIVGPWSDYAEYLYNYVKQLGLTGRIHFLHNVDDAQLVHLMRNAALFIMPSLVEGFGLPILEAMAVGTPIACSRIPVFVEVCGDAAVYFNPLDVADIATTLRQVLDSPALRSYCIEQGAVRVRSFTWEGAAEAIYNIYNRLFSSGSDR